MLCVANPECAVLMIGIAGAIIISIDNTIKALSEYNQSSMNNNAFCASVPISTKVSKDKIEGKGKHYCEVTCNINVYDQKLDGKVPERVRAAHRGNSEYEACTAAKHKAEALAPKVTYARHCHCKCKKK
jgi:hypothetical protein